MATDEHLMVATSPERRPKWLASAIRAPMDARTMSRVIARLKSRIPDWAPTALARVAEQTARDPFKILIGCVLSLRTRDETTGPAAARLFDLAADPRAMLRLSRRQIERAIFPVGFYRTKARAIHAICQELIARFEALVPADLEALLTLPGVGRKTANLVVTVSFGLPGICVDTHVHRITNRLSFVRTATPERTEWALRAKLPARHWIGINDLLVAFGQNVCQPLSPKCSACPVRRSCLRVGVTRSR